MKKNYLSVGAFFVVAIALMLTISACSSNKAQVKVNANANASAGAQPPAAPPTPPPAEGAKANANANVNANGVLLYDYDKVNHYEYKITSTSGGQTSVANIKYNIGSESYNGQSAWVLSSDVALEGATATSKVYMSKATRRCIAVEIESAVLGQTYKTQSKCDTATEVQTDAKGSAQVTAEGTETVTVPAGTFTATKYSTSSGATYWMAAGVPVPVKFSASAAGATSVGELVSFS